MIQAKSKQFILSVLPYEQNALMPYISSMTINFHYDKHHRGYLDKLNELVAGTRFEGLELEEVIVYSMGHPDEVGIFNNAAQVWNHDFYWNSLTPKVDSKPSGELGRKIEAAFGDYENFITKFSEAGLKCFGSGWIWLVEDHGALKITKTPNAENPLTQGHGKALLALDVWEHSYYLDYQNRRQDYLSAVLRKILNWDFAEMNLVSSRPQAPGDYSKDE